MPFQPRIVVAALAVVVPSFVAQAAQPGTARTATQLASVTFGPSALDEPFAHIEPSPAPVEPAAAEAAPEPATDAPEAVEAAPQFEPSAASAVPAAPASAVPAAPASPGAPAGGAAPRATPSVATPVKPAAHLAAKPVESPLLDPTAPIPEPVILSEPGSDLDAAAAPVVPAVRVPTAAERAAASAARKAGAQNGGSASGSPRPVELAAAPAEPPEVIRPVPPALASLPPKVIDVPAEPSEPSGPSGRETPRRRHFTADRDALMREFPDELVESLWIQDWRDIERGYMFGRLVDVTSDPEGRGIVLRLDGESRIGELEDDPYRQMLLCKLAKPAAGLLYRIASRLRLIEGEAYEPLEITSLVRTWDYQVRLSDINPNADRTRDGVPPTHVLGLAFDIARTAMSDERQERVELLLDQLALDGELAYYKEGSTNGLMHYHVIALPSADLLLARHYEREQQVVERRQEAQARHRTLPDAPCVMFGSSLEPFSAICSCELPVEVSAASLADAPISR